MYLSKTLYPLLSTGSTQEDRKSYQHDCKTVDWELNHLEMLNYVYTHYCIGKICLQNLTNHQNNQGFFYAKLADKSFKKSQSGQKKVLIIMY